MVARKAKFSNIEIVYKNDNYHQLIFFKIEAYVANKWMLIDDNVNCKELKSSSIISCGPTKLKKINVLSFSLNDCERIYYFNYEKNNNLLIRLKTVNYPSGKTKYFPPFLVKK